MRKWNESDDKLLAVCLMWAAHCSARWATGDTWITTVQPSGTADIWSGEEVVVKHKPPPENPQWAALQPATELQRCRDRRDPAAVTSEGQTPAFFCRPAAFNRKVPGKILFLWLCEKHCKKQGQIIWNIFKEKLWNLTYTDLSSLKLNSIESNFTPCSEKKMRLHGKNAQKSPTVSIPV